MARVVQQQIKQPLAEELLFGKLQQGGTVHVDLKDNELEITCEASDSVNEIATEVLKDAVKESEKTDTALNS